MIAYPRQDIETTLWLDDVRELRDAGFVTKAQWKAAETREKLQVNRNILMRLLFAILGFLGCLAVGGAVSIVSIPLLDHFNWFMGVYLIAYVAITEMVIRLKFFRYGLDDVAILVVQGCFCSWIYTLTESNLATAAALFLITILSAIRYVNVLSGILAVAALAGTVAVFVLDFGAVNKFTLPFFLFALAIALLFGINRLKKADGIYRDVFFFAECTSWILLYLSVNYLVVREAAASLMGFSPAPGSDLPFAWVFYGFTFVIPIAYLYLGIKWRRRELLWIWMAAFAFSIYAIRYYHHLMPLEWALLLGGTLLFAFSFYLYRRFRGIETGITYESGKFSRSRVLKTAELLIANAQAAQVHAPASGPMEFGGGNFSGGGSANGY